MLRLCKRVCSGQRFSSTFQVSSTQASSVVITKVTSPRLRPDPALPVVFGKYIADHMLDINWTLEGGWETPMIKPYEPLKLDPAISALHYAVECYEEMEAVKSADGSVLLFRPDLYMKRLYDSAGAVCLPPFDPIELTSLIKKMVSLDKEWIPTGEDHGLYLRINYFSNHNVLGVTRALKAKITAYASPHGRFSQQGLHPVRLFCDETVTRTWPGGVGQYKIGANYACGIMHTDRIRKLGYQHLLWSVSKGYVDGNVTEAGRMNFFLVMRTKQGELEVVTPPLDGLIIPGVTRECALVSPNQDLIKDLPEYDIVERPISVDELIDALKEKRIVECFSTGSRMFVVPVQTLHLRGKVYEVPLKLKNSGKLAKWLHDRLKEIQWGRKPHPWAVKVE